MPAVTVRVPATSANLGPGFDCLGLALALYDEVTVEATDSGVDVDVVGQGAAEVPRDGTHLVIRAVRAGAGRLGTEGLGNEGLGTEGSGAASTGLRLRARNAIPHGRGLGSSAAAVIAGLLAARALHPDGAARLSDPDLLALAADMEGHPDNAAACLLGGLTLAWQDCGVPQAVRLDPHEDVRVTMLIPPTGLSTQLARGLLPLQVPHADAAFNAGRAALLVHALTAEPSLLLAATEDLLHQSYRAPAMPQTAAVISGLRARGIPAVVSGAGPSVTAFTAQDVTALVPPGWSAQPLAVDLRGAVVGPAAG